MVHSEVQIAARKERPGQVDREEALHLGERVRQLRAARGLTQTGLAGGRFSKEYVSQIERGKTRPTPETLAWLAGRLGVDTEFLEHGISSDEHGRLEATLARAEGLSEAGDFTAAVAEFASARTAFGSVSALDLEVRALAGEAWARMETGELESAIELLHRGLRLTEAPGFSDVQR